MALLGMAFAMPMIRKSGLGWLGEAPRDVAIVLDASYSMGYHTERGTVWDKGIEAATAIIEGLSDKDRFCIFLAHEQPEALVAEPVANKTEGLSRLRAQQPGQSSSRLAPALAAAMKALLKADARREREIHIITDNQALPWQSVATEKVDLDAKTAVFVSLLGVPAPENAGVASVELQPPVARKGADVKVTAKLLRTGAPADTTLTLIIDDKEAGRRSIAANDPEAAAPSFTLPPLAIGMHAARIQTP
ncbi:MAG TPA: VWA domain-containing protein, partial [Bradyrhizobium sp.]|nr:VWA domain-containing protein [Bradyrhizobium sp.]